MIDALIPNKTARYSYQWRRVAALRSIFDVFKGVRGESPVSSLISKTAIAQYKVVFLSIVFALLLGGSELCVFATIYTVGRLISGAPMPAFIESVAISRSTTFTILLLALLSLQLISSFSRYMSSMLSSRIASHCEANIVPVIHRYILSLSFDCASSFKAGDLAHRANIAASAISIEIEEKSSIISNGLLVAVYVFILVCTSPWLILIGSLLGIAITTIQSFLKPKIRSASRYVEKRRRDIAGAITSDIQVLRLLHSSAAIRNAEAGIDQMTTGYEQDLNRLSNLRSTMEPVAEALPMLAAVLIGLLSWQLSGGQSELMIPGLATFILALQRLNIRLIKLGHSSTRLAENTARIDQLNDLLRADNKTFRRLGGRQFSGLKGEINFQNVGLRYPGRPEAALTNISFTIPRSSSVALVGSSGAGKSTILDLLVGLLIPSSGKILVDGEDLQSLSLESWQQHLGVVSQDVLLIHDTIAANISFGLESSVSRAAIEHAAIAACADEFINQLPDRYDTVVGEHGHRLSGGQRQRLSLARAILRAPDILILDEATSALDSHLESRVHAAIQAFGSGRTVLAVAHRLSSIRDAQMILVIDAGRVVERGTHNSLLASGGMYEALWNRQQGLARTNQLLNS